MTCHFFDPTWLLNFWFELLKSQLLFKKMIGFWFSAVFCFYYFLEAVLFLALESIRVVVYKWLKIEDWNSSLAVFIAFFHCAKFREFLGHDQTLDTLTVPFFYSSAPCFRCFFCCGYSCAPSKWQLPTAKPTPGRTTSTCIWITCPQRPWPSVCRASPRPPRSSRGWMWPRTPLRCLVNFQATNWL